MHQTNLLSDGRVDLDVPLMRYTILIFLSIMSLSVFSDEYFCNYKGGSSGTSTGVVIFERNQDGINVKYENSERTFEIIRDDEEVLLFQYINDNSNGTLSSIDLRSINKKSKKLTFHIIFMTYPEVSYHYQGECILND